MMNLKVIIQLIELEYPRLERNTPEKMRVLIHKEFNLWVDSKDIMRVCGIIVEDFEEQSNKIENGY